MTPSERKYLNDPHYHALVNSMVALIKERKITSSEARDAAILAADIFIREAQKHEVWR
jgi:hypothetical protein